MNGVWLAFFSTYIIYTFSKKRLQLPGSYTSGCTGGYTSGRT